MTENDLPDSIRLPDVYQHWCDHSERYCGGDALVTILERGWELAGTVYVEYKWFSGNRRTAIYHCLLSQGREVRHMSMLANPFVTRLLQELGMTLIEDDSRSDTAVAQPVSIARN